MENDDIPAWATGPDCFESDAQRQEVETDRGSLANNLISAYCLGDLHALANAVETFQQSHRLLYREELRALHHQITSIILFIDRSSYAKDFPLQETPGHHEHSA